MIWIHISIVDYEGLLDRHDHEIEKKEPDSE
jgi:hypothetical protein